MSSQQRLDAAYGRRGGSLQSGSRLDFDALPVCPACGGRVCSPGRATHFLCDPSTFPVGRGAVS